MALSNTNYFIANKIKKIGFREGETLEASEIKEYIRNLNVDIEDVNHSVQRLLSNLQRKKVIKKINPNRQDGQYEVLVDTEEWVEYDLKKWFEEREV